MESNTLRSKSNDELLRRLAELTADSRRLETDLVAHIGEVDVRRLYLREACPSMFVYCTRRLHLSEAEALLRITAARAARRHPALLDMLGDGRLHLSAILLLAPHLTLENREAVLARAVHRTKRQVEELVAELCPQPDAPDLIRRLPQRETGAPSPMAAGAPPALSCAGLDSPQSARAVEVDLSTERPIEAAGKESIEAAVKGLLTPAAGERNGSVELRLVPERVVEVAAPCDPFRVPLLDRKPAFTIQPIAPQRYKVQFTASRDLVEKLERLRALLRQSLRSDHGDLAAAVEVAVSEKLERLERQRFGGRAQTGFAVVKGPGSGPLKRGHQHERFSDSPRASLGTSPSSRHIPAAVRRAVRARDGDQCRFVDVQGRRCSARERLEFHHRRPYGFGGGHTVENLGLVCRAHNGYLAEADYGRLRADAHHGAGSADSGDQTVLSASRPGRRSCRAR